MNPIASWGRIPAQGPTRRLRWRDEPLLRRPGEKLLPHGMGRSYGDSCLNDQGTLLLTRGLSRFRAFNPEAGLLACEAGVTLDEILELVVPYGFFLPVVPGTKLITVGGAIANDVHGKNHHRAGTFGCHVGRLELARSDGSRRLCSPTQNPELFAATVGGLGLTGLITWAELVLRRIPSPYIEAETVPMRDLDSFFEISERSDKTHEYTVAWVDCLARGAHLGRGLFFRGNHVAHEEVRRKKGLPLGVPFDFPGFTLNRLTVMGFNTFYRLWNGRGGHSRTRVTHYDPFFFPLDSVDRWNRIYGKRGLYQFQCVVPFGHGDQGIRRILETIGDSGQASFLAVLKTFGDVSSPGMLSFPRPGVTLALDFPNRGEKVRSLLKILEELVLEHGGAMYPAKDALMSPAMFRASYPRADDLARLADPRFSSSFWRRVRHGEPA